MSIQPAWQEAPPEKWGNGPGQQPYFTPGAFRAFRAAIWTMIFLPLMIRIGKNWYQRTGDVEYAFGRAFLLSAMWKVWGTAVVWWLGVAWCIGNPDDNFFTAYQDGHPNNPTIIGWCWLLQVFVSLPALGVAYCQLVDRSLFQRRFVYRMVAPIHKMLGRCPWVLLISLTLVPIFFYIQLAVVRA